MTRENFPQLVIASPSTALQALRINFRGAEAKQSRDRADRTGSLRFARNDGLIIGGRGVASRCLSALEGKACEISEWFRRAGLCAAARRRGAVVPGAWRAEILQFPGRLSDAAEPDDVCGWNDPRVHRLADRTSI